MSRQHPTARKNNIVDNRREMPARLLIPSRSENPLSPAIGESCPNSLSVNAISIELTQQNSETKIPFPLPQDASPRLSTLHVKRNLRIVITLSHWAVCLISPIGNRATPVRIRSLSTRPGRTLSTRPGCNELHQHAPQAWMLCRQVHATEHVAGVSRPLQARLANTRLRRGGEAGGSTRAKNAS